LRRYFAGRAGAAGRAVADGCDECARSDALMQEVAALAHFQLKCLQCTLVRHSRAGGSPVT
jgi:hypothetical protein